MSTDVVSETIKITIKPENSDGKTVTLTGDITIPPTAGALVLFSHGSGSSRLSPRNRFVAEKLQDKNIGTFLFDLLTEEEDEVYENRFNIDLLTERLIEVTHWAKSQELMRLFKFGYFGASTGAASALKAAAELGNTISAVVSRGGRPDLAIPEIKKVTSPTLLIVGGLDYGVIELNEKAAAELKGVKKLVIVEGATHLFEEPGKLEEVSALAADWFTKYLHN
ncbi:MAG: dienelactone hydrolase family protein [Bacteroidia bacterium]